MSCYRLWISMFLLTDCSDGHMLPQPTTHLQKPRERGISTLSKSESICVQAACSGRTRWSSSWEISLTCILVLASRETRIHSKLAIKIQLSKNQYKVTRL